MENGWCASWALLFICTFFDMMQGSEVSGLVCYWYGQSRISGSRYTRHTIVVLVHKLSDVLVD
jgi:hypothetical protein